MKVLVTGASGFLGGAVARFLAQQGDFEIRGIGTRHPSAVRWPAGVRYWQQAVEDVDVEAHGVDAIVHCAGTSDVEYAARSPRRAVRDTVEATAWLLHSAMVTENRVVILSTQSVYGGRGVPLIEAVALRPRSVYGALMAAREMVALAYWHSVRSPVVVLRLCNVYGPGERPGALVRNFLTAALRRQPMRVEGDGAQVRCLLYVEDMARAVHAALTGFDALVGLAWNVAGPAVSIRELAEACGRVAGYEEIVHAPARAHEEGRVELDAAAFRGITGWAPRVPIDHGLDRMSEWLQRTQADGAIPALGADP